HPRLLSDHRHGATLSGKGEAAQHERRTEVALTDLVRPFGVPTHDRVYVAASKVGRVGDNNGILPVEQLEEPDAPLGFTTEQVGTHATAADFYSNADRHSVEQQLLQTGRVALGEVGDGAAELVPVGVEAGLHLVGLAQLRNPGVKMGTGLDQATEHVGA